MDDLPPAVAPPEELPPAVAPDVPVGPVLDPTQIRVVDELKQGRPLLGCRCDPTGEFVAASGQENIVYLWKLAARDFTPLAGHVTWGRALAFHPTAGLLYSGDYAGEVIAWDYLGAAPQTPRFRISAHQGWVRALAVSPDGALLASVGNDNAVRLWSALDGQPIAELGRHTRHVYHVAFSPDGSALVTGDLLGQLKHWDVAGRSEVRTLDGGLLWLYDTTFLADIGGFRGLAFSPDGRYLAGSGVTEVSNAFAGIGVAVVVLWNWATGERIQSIKAKDHPNSVGWACQFLASGDLATATNSAGNGQMFFVHPDQAAAAAEPFHTFALPSGARDLSAHPDGKRLVAAHLDGLLRVYDLSVPG